MLCVPHGQESQSLEGTTLDIALGFSSLHLGIHDATGTEYRVFCSGFQVEEDPRTNAKRREIYIGAEADVHEKKKCSLCCTQTKPGRKRCIHGVMRDICSTCSFVLQ